MNDILILICTLCPVYILPTCPSVRHSVRPFFQDWLIFNNSFNKLTEVTELIFGESFLLSPKRCKWGIFWPKISIFELFSISLSIRFFLNYVSWQVLKVVGIDCVGFLRTTSIMFLMRLIGHFWLQNQHLKFSLNLFIRFFWNCS